MPSKPVLFVTLDNNARQGGPSPNSSSTPSIDLTSMSSVILFKSSAVVRLASATFINCSNVKNVPSMLIALRFLLSKYGKFINCPGFNIPVSGSFVSCVCLGNISQSGFKLNKGNRLLKNDTTNVDGTNSAINKYRCKPPLLDSIGIRGRSYFCIVSR